MADDNDKIEKLNNQQINGEQFEINENVVKDVENVDEPMETDCNDELAGGEKLTESVDNENKEDDDLQPETVAESTGAGDEPPKAKEQTPPPAVQSPSHSSLKSPSRTVHSPKMEISSPVREKSPRIGVQSPASDKSPRAGEKSPRGRKRKATGCSDDDDEEEEFKGFTTSNVDISLDSYEKTLDKIENEIKQTEALLTPVRRLMRGRLPSGKKSRIGTPIGTDNSTSRPSSGLSHKSDEILHGEVSSPAGRSSKARVSVDIGSKLFRIPLEQGWKRELVFRAALDSTSKRNADIYYYTPDGKKLRSSREVGEYLGSNSTLTLDNFTFFKEALGIDDPDKEIIRDAKVIRREGPSAGSPSISNAPVEGKRTPKPKQPKGASPEPPTKIKIKSVGSRLSTGSPAGTPKARQRKSSPPNNNNTSYKKSSVSSVQPMLVPVAANNQGRQMLPPCSVRCGGGAVPDVQCSVCLCLYHAACIGLMLPIATSYVCANCKPVPQKATVVQPPVAPPPLMHKSAVKPSQGKYILPPSSAVPNKVPMLLPKLTKATEQNIPIPQPVPVRRITVKSPTRTKQSPPDSQRLVVKMKMQPSNASPTGKAMWTVQNSEPTAAQVVQINPMEFPQSIAIINGKKFLVVPKNTFVSATSRHSLGRTESTNSDVSKSKPNDVSTVLE